MRRPGRVRDRRAIWLILAVGVLSVLAAISPGADATRPHAVTPPARPPAAPAVSSTAFASRAGYAAWQAAGAVGAVPALRPQTVDVVFSPQNNSSSSAPGAGPVPVARFARAHGLSAAAYAAAERFFLGDGLRVVHAWPDRLALSLEGTPAALDRAFATTLLAASFDGRPVVFPAAAPSLPDALEREVAGIVGLSSGFVRFSISLAGTAPSSSGNSITPGMARSLYDLSPLYNLSGGGQFATSRAIAIILWGAGYAPSDISTFYSQDYPASFPAPTIVPYPIDGASAPSDAALSSPQPLDVEELTLDLEWSGSTAPGATLYPIYPPGASTTNLTDAFEKALSLPNVSAISMSFGAPETSDSSLISAWGSLFSEAEDRDITVLAATGDTGGDQNASCTGGPASEYPASSPDVVAVGGTAVTVDRNPLGGITGYSEAAWSGGGGGFSVKFRAPGWQLLGSAGEAIEAAGGGRGTPDVSATASDDFIYYDGANQEADGTSFATPLWAGLVTDLGVHIGHPLGFFTDRLYFVANETEDKTDAGFYDIDSGSNCIASAVPGWDAATGWGSPRAVDLEEDLAGSFVDLALDESPTTVAPGGSLTVRAQVANATTQAAIPNTPVVLSLAGDTSVGPCVGTFGSITVTSNSTGWVAASLSVPACYLGSHAVASASVATDRLFGRSSTQVAVNLLGFVPALEMLGNAPYSYALYAGIMAAAIALGGWWGRGRPPAPGTVPAPGPVRAPPAPAAAPPSPGPPPAAPNPTPSGPASQPPPTPG